MYLNLVCQYISLKGINERQTLSGSVQNDFRFCNLVVCTCKYNLIWLTISLAKRSFSKKKFIWLKMMSNHICNLYYIILDILNIICNTPVEGQTYQCCKNNTFMAKQTNVRTKYMTVYFMFLPFYLVFPLNVVACIYRLQNHLINNKPSKWI
jgi:hypothetical protein